MVFYPKVHQSKTVKGMRNLLGLCVRYDFGIGKDFVESNVEILMICG